MFGDGTHVRDFTFIDDVVSSNLLAAEGDLPPGTVVNIAGGSSVDMRSLVDLVESGTGEKVAIERLARKPGDVAQTGGEIKAASSLLGWEPMIGIEEGLSRQIEWQKNVEKTNRSGHLSLIDLQGLRTESGQRTHPVLAS